MERFKPLRTVLYCAGLALGLAACKGDDPAPPNDGVVFPTDREPPGEEVPKTTQVRYIEDGNADMEVLRFAVTTSNRVVESGGSTPSSPIDIFPGDEGFTVDWSIKSSFVLVSENFLNLAHGEETTSVLEIFVNPIPEALVSRAVCTYNNESVLTCQKPPTIATYEARKVTSLTTIFDTLPKTLELRAKVCNLMNGCDIVQVAYLRFN